MAEIPVDFGGPAATTDVAPVPPEYILRTLSLYDRETLGSVISLGIEILDQRDGDPDVEANGDELDGSLTEDDFCSHNLPLHLQGPGCPFTDPGEDEERDDPFCDPVAYRRHRDRIRGTRCRLVYSPARGAAVWRLNDNGGQANV